MGLITALTTQKKNQQRVNLFLDGEFAFGIPVDAAIGLKIGQELSEQEISRLQELDQFAKAKDQALRLIVRRPHSIFEIERRLRSKKYSDETITQVIARLQELDLLNDEAFAQYWVEQRETFKPRSQIMLRQELQQKGIDRQLIDTILGDLDEEDAARRLAKQKVYRWSHLPYDEFRAKISRFLQQRGFRYDTIKKITNEIWHSMTETVSNSDND